MDKLLQFYCDYFLDDKTENPFLLLSSNVCIKVLSEKFNIWTKKGEAPAMETLPLSEKTRYWEIALKYHTDKTKRIMASKSAYALELMTGK